MLSDDFKGFSDDLIHKLTDDVTEAERVQRAEIIANKIKETVDGGRLFVIDNDEVNLLNDYRAWKKSNTYMPEVFHWRVRR